MATQRAQRTIVEKGNDRHKERFVGKSHAESLRAYLCQYVNVDPDDPSVGWVDVTYKHCAIGKRLVEDGFIAGARVYGGRSATPFLQDLWVHCHD
jgi:hypothetical protein